MESLKCECELLSCQFLKVGCLYNVLTNLEPLEKKGELIAIYHINRHKTELFQASWKVRSPYLKGNRISVFAKLILCSFCGCCS